MADDRFQRFRHLERPRAAERGGGPSEASPGTEERFEALEERAPNDPPEAGAAPVFAGQLDRFRPAAERPLELATMTEGELPFVRCARCQIDHNRSVSVCTNCGADLQTGEQRAFNARLADERRAQAAVEQAQAAELERDRRESDEATVRAKRAMGEALAREVGGAERRRHDAEGLGGFGSPPGRGGWGGSWGGSDSGWDGAGWGAGRYLGFGLIGWLVRFLFRRRDLP